MTATLPCMAWVVTTLIALLAAAASGPILRALPLPHVSEGAPTPDYASLATRRTAVGVGVLTWLATVLVTLTMDPVWWWAWLSLTLVGVLAAWVDAHMTYLPKRLAHAGWALAASGLAAAAIVAGDPGIALRAAAGALAAGAGFWLLWRLGGIGFGDVRLMTTVGAITAAHGWGLWAAALVLGTTAGAAWGVLHRLRGGSQSFPYGPGLTLGPFLALALQWLVR